MADPTVRWYDGPPPLEQPVVIAAFTGWNDAGDAASDALRYVARATHAIEVGELEPDDFVDYQASRPHVEIVAGVARAITWPATTALASPSADVLLLIGSEPTFRWREYCTRVTDTALAVDARLVVTLGALLGDTPHSRPVTVTGTATDQALIGIADVERSTYEGPTGIVGALHAACRDAGLPSVSLWAPVPHYAATPPCPKATAALLERLRAVCELAIDTGRLEIASAAWERQVDAQVRKTDDLAVYVQALEEAYDARGNEPDEAPGSDRTSADEAPPLPSGDALAAELEQYLRDLGGEP